MNPPPSPRSFTLIELMAASTVLSVVLLFMVGMQDQMSKAWSNANRRTDSTREARAGLRMMTEDFTHYYIRANSTSSSYRASYNPRTVSVPFIYFRDATNAVGGLSIPDAQPQSQAVFFLSQRGRGRESIYPSDRLEAVGYYIASYEETNINGFVSTNFHLFRYINTNVLLDFQKYSTDTSSIARLFPRVGPTFRTNNEILARNSLNLRIYFYPSTQLPSSGIIQDFPLASDNGYTGNRCVFELTSYPENVANSLLQGGSTMSAWTNTNNLRRFSRTFEITADVERGL